METMTDWPDELLQAVDYAIHEHVYNDFGSCVVEREAAAAVLNAIRDHIVLKSEIICPGCLEQPMPDEHCGFGGCPAGRLTYVKRSS